ncbi:thiamine diphosphokinase [Sediminibacillus massiliensis]|uniref:thiamine diphosphokinase n=1 Tax=Sediminibacillus massiliensis TaxID=1926277 RepID=UPI0009888345|nr:thiamine diphosphokinase [Sediminibacillus massiliensis]
MGHVAIVGGGPVSYVPDLSSYKEVSYWIGADRGALTLIENGITPDLALGDFDSISAEEKELIKKQAKNFKEYPAEKDETDLELAVEEAVKKNASEVFFFGVSGGRKDHELANIQLLYHMRERNIHSWLIDIGNKIELVKPGIHGIEAESPYEYISFLPFSEKVTGITLKGFYYNLENTTIKWGSTLCISNKLLLEKGTFSFEDGILIVIKSRDVFMDGR